MHAPVPAIEVADHADALGVRRPAGEAHAGDAVARLRMRRPSMRQACVQPAFVEQIAGRDRTSAGGNAYGLASFDGVARVVLDPQGERRPGRIGAAPLEQSVLEPRHRFMARRASATRPGARGDRNAGPRPPVGSAMRTEERVRIVQAAPRAMRRCGCRSRKVGVGMPARMASLRRRRLL